MDAASRQKLVAAITHIAAARHQLVEMQSAPTTSSAVRMEVSRLIVSVDGVHNHLSLVDRVTMPALRVTSNKPEPMEVD